MQIKSLLLTLSALTILYSNSIWAQDDQQIKEPTPFSKGETRLSSSMFGQGVAGGARLNELYNERKWNELVEGVLSKKFVSDLYYFYLGRAAEEQGFFDAAIIYYSLSIGANASGDTCNFGFDSCRGISIPSYVVERSTNLKLNSKVFFNVFTSNKVPIEGVVVSVQSSQSGAPPISCSTNSAGNCFVPGAFTTKDVVLARTSKKGLVPEMFKLDSSKIDNNYNLTLTDVKEYLCDDIKTSAKENLASDLSNWVLSILNSAMIQNSTLAKNGICFTAFKAKTYASLTVNHDSTFNKNKLNNYGIGVLVFDEVIRKMLNPIASATNSLLIEGYDISITTSKRNFIGSIATAETLTFRFYLPKQTVQKYKDKDITGQQLIDASIVLLDDERIDLKLQ